MSSHRKQNKDSSSVNVCRQFMKGTCSYDPCKFFHDANLCFDWWISGSCNSTTCPMKHPANCRGQGEGNSAAPASPKHNKKEGNAAAVQSRKGEGGAAKDEVQQNSTNNTRREAQRTRRQPRQAQAALRNDEYASDEEPRADATPKTTRGSNTRQGGLTKLPMPRVNTETFKPSHEPCAMRMVVDVDPNKLSVPLTVRDVLYVPLMFKRNGDANIYDRLVKEVESCSIPQDTLLKSWHGDSHWIADDQTGWKKECPTFLDIITRLKEYFNMDIRATRFNWYKDTSEWKPFHHDAAAVKPDKARTQNFTVAVSFGATRDAAFEDAKTRTTIAMPQPDGTVYCFARDTNILWRHGILQEREVRQEGRISIIAWGWVDQSEV